MISAILLHSLAFAAATVLYVAVALRLRASELLSAALAAIGALALSSFVVAQASVEVIGYHGLLLLRFLPSAAVLFAGNPFGSPKKGFVQTVFVWCALDFVFVVNFGQNPRLPDYLDSYMPVYVMFPLALGYLNIIVRALFGHIGKRPGPTGPHHGSQDSSRSREPGT